MFKSQRYFGILLLGLVYIMALASCVREQPQVIVITATFLPATVEIASANTPIPNIVAPTPIPNTNLINPTLNAPANTVSQEIPTEYAVQSGDTLFLIAQRFNVGLNALIELNNITNPDVLEVGQVLQLPNIPTQQSPSFKILPDSRLVRAPRSNQFDIGLFISQQTGYINRATDTVTTRVANGAGFDEVLTSAQIIQRVSLEYSIDPRILMAILEFRAGWLSNPNPRADLLQFPIISQERSAGFNRTGLYRQLAYVANELNRGYYGWKGRNLRTLEFTSGERIQINPSLNAGSIGVQYFLSLGNNFNIWNLEVQSGGLYAVYVRYFGDPFIDTIEPLVPNGIQQPVLLLPFASGETWYYTGGPHGGWGNGSGWSSLDFAPPDERPPGSEFCYSSQFFVRALANGLIIRSEGGAVVLDLDNDGDESTGWTIMYLHLADTTPAGTIVMAGDPIGKASCAGGFSTATHLHVGRRYNGEWLPADCSQCLEGYVTPNFVMSNWVADGIAGQEYQGFLNRDGIQKQAEQGRESTINHISW
jgi:LasA protease